MAGNREKKWKFFSPFFVGRFSVLEDDARGDFLSHPIARNLIEAKTVAVALKKIAE